MKRGSDWSPIYMLLVVAIVAILIITLIKPVFQNAAEASTSTTNAARNVAAGALFLSGLVLRRRG